MTIPTRLPVLFLSHGGGPWPYIEEMKASYSLTTREFARLPDRLPAIPRAVLAVTAHWEAPAFAVSTGAAPPMNYDYSGFPEHTYRIHYAAPGSPAVASRVIELLGAAGIEHLEDANRGFDHGTFVPLALMYPQADMPIVMLSLKSNFDAAEHLRMGRVLEPLREEGVLIVGSGLTYHNMRGFAQAASGPISEAFEGYLNQAIAASDPKVRNAALEHWERAPAARLAHPREDHLLPLMVAAGAAGADRGQRLFVEHVMNVAMASYVFGDLRPMVK